MTATAPCPCNSGVAFGDCCEPLISGKRFALSAAALMRSRYTAYVLRHIPYLLASWHPATRPMAIDPATIPDWQGLEVMRTEKGGEADTAGVVEFTATALTRKGPCLLHEVSRFVKEDGHWFYVDGELPGAVVPAERMARQVGRNDPCPCGSGKKYKRCCSS